MSENLDQIVQGKAQKWLDGNYDSKTKDQVKYLMENDKKEFTESFYKDLEFGTGGLRGGEAAGGLYGYRYLRAVPLPDGL